MAPWSNSGLEVGAKKASSSLDRTRGGEAPHRRFFGAKRPGFVRNAG